MLNHDAALAIFGMALVTIGARVGGLWLMSRFKSLKKLERILHYTPGSIISAIVVPAVLMNGIDDAIASAAVVLVMILSKNLLLSMCTGVGVVLLIRYIST